MPTADSLLARNVVLAIVAERPRHGWAVHRELAPGSDIGRAWSLSRQLTYRAITNLEKEGLVRRAARQSGEGADRVILSPTPGGRRHVRKWLDEPVAHIRDVRTELLVKLMLRERAGLDSTQFIRIQTDRLLPVVQALTSDDPRDVVDAWRSAAASSVMGFLDGLNRTGGPARAEASGSRRRQGR